LIFFSHDFSFANLDFILTSLWDNGDEYFKDRIWIICTFEAVIIDLDVKGICGLIHGFFESVIYHLESLPVAAVTEIMRVNCIFSSRNNLRKYFDGKPVNLTHFDTNQAEMYLL